MQHKCWRNSDTEAQLLAGKGIYAYYSTQILSIFSGLLISLHCYESLPRNEQYWSRLIETAIVNEKFNSFHDKNGWRFDRIYEDEA